MLKQKQLLWPYSKVLAIIAIPLIWILFVVILAIIKQYVYWPTEETTGPVTIGILILSLIPLVLVLLDFFAARGAVIETKWGKIDFSRIDLSRQDVRKESFGLPENIGVKGAIVYDSSPMKIVSTLQLATANEIVIIDIKDGNAWWVSRLLALSAGAVRAGNPKVFVFKGMKENKPGTYLGWAEPVNILNAILNAKSAYKETYNNAWQITKQVNLFGTSDINPVGLALNFEVQRYVDSPHGYVNLGEAAFEQILMEQMGKPFPVNPNESLENPPDWLTLSRFNDLFGSYLYREFNLIDLTWSSEEQISHLLTSQTTYLALVRNGIYESMLNREDGERLILKELFRQSQENKQQGT